MNIAALLLLPYRLRILFRSAFFLLAVATVALALFVLQQEKQLSYKNYQHSFYKTKEQISATLRHPAGQLALLNPHTSGASVTPLHPVLLPFSAIDFDDHSKVQQAAEMSGCLVQYDDHGALCVAIGNNPWAGAFIYVIGSFAGSELVSHERGDLDLDRSHRVRVAVSMRGQMYRWIAPFETMGEFKGGGVRGRLTGFVDSGADSGSTKPLKEFRGWVWQSGHCIKPEQDGRDAGCARHAFFSMRLPVAVLQEELFQKKRPVWPPADLDKILVHVEVLSPGGGAALLDSNSDSAVPPFSVTDLMPLLLPGETLRIRKQADTAGADLVSLVGATAAADDSWQLLTRIFHDLCGVEV